MRLRQIKPIVAAALLVLAAGWSARRAIVAPAVVHAQQSSPAAAPAQQPAQSPGSRRSFALSRAWCAWT